MDVLHYILLTSAIIPNFIFLVKYLKRKFRSIQKVKEFDAMCNNVLHQIKDSADSWDETVALFKALEYNGYKNHQTKLRLNTDFE
jgi:hypothetical protein